MRPQTRSRDRGPWTKESPRIAIWATRTRSCRIDAGNMAAAPTPGKTARRVAAVCNGGSPANRVLRIESHTSIATSMPTTTRRLTQRAGDDSIVSSIHLIKARHRFHKPRLSIGRRKKTSEGHVRLKTASGGCFRTSISRLVRLGSSKTRSLGCTHEIAVRRGKSRLPRTCVRSSWHVRQKRDKSFCHRRMRKNSRRAGGYRADPLAWPPERQPSPRQLRTQSS